MSPILGVGLMIVGALVFFLVLAWLVTKQSKTKGR